MSTRMPRRCPSTGFLALTALLLAPASAFSQVTSREDAIIAPADTAPMASFGRAVSISGDFALVGAVADKDTGTAYILQRSGTTWVVKQKLVAADAAPNDHFGISVALEGDIAVIGSPQDDDGGANTGSVYVYRKVGANWVPQPKLHASDAQAGDVFGNSVSLEGGALLVGAPNADALGKDSGAAYAYRWNGSAFVGEQKLLAGVADDWFGWTVATDGQVALVGAIGDGTKGSLAGAAHAYRWNGASWVHEQKLTASNGAAGDWYGWGLDIEGDLAIVGAIHHDEPLKDSGAAYVIRWNGSSWVEQQQLGPYDATIYDFFGYSVAISGDRALIGSPGASNGSGPGAAFVFQDSGPLWVESHKWVASNPNDGGPFLDNLGLGVALRGTTALIGAPFATNPTNGLVDSGSVYAYRLTALALEALPDAVAPGQNLEFRTWGGLPGGPMGLLLTDVGGTPVSLLFYLSAFDGLGRNSLPIVMPAGASGIDIGVVAAGYWQAGKVGPSNLATVTLH